MAEVIERTAPRPEAVPQRLVIGGAPEGHDARLLAHLARDNQAGGVLHIAADDERATRLVRTLAFFAPDVEVVFCPSWDCLPYDRISPDPTVVGRRVSALARAARRTPSSGPFVLLATAAAALQRIPPVARFRDPGIVLHPGDMFDAAALAARLIENGYLKTDTVREPGEIATTHLGIDVFAPNLAAPLRLSGADGRLAAIRSFDPLSQRSTAEAGEAILGPMGELSLDPASIERFTAGYRAAFGAAAQGDPLYAAVSAGRRYSGMEHWLPLFHDTMASVFDVLPDALVSFDGEAVPARDERLLRIQRFHDARIDANALEATPYRPLPPERIALTAAEWEDILAHREAALLSAEPDVGIDAGGRPGPTFVRPDGEEPWEAVRRHAERMVAEGVRLMVACYSAGSADRMTGLLADRGGVASVRVSGWTEAEGLPERSVPVAVLALGNGFISDDLAIVTEQDILGGRLVRSISGGASGGTDLIAEVSALMQGDLVVHPDHGIGLYDGLETLDVVGAAHDCLRVVYADDARLYVPVEAIGLLARYGSADGAALDRMGSASWKARRERLAEQLSGIAGELIRTAAQRRLREAPVFNPPRSAMESFAARFPYPETEDQIKAIDAVLADLRSGRPMDRLVCGDVGFGKTEVALRAAFAVAAAGGQVAMIAPTTLLARQHFASFSERFRGLHLPVAQLSRLNSPEEMRRVKAGLADGSVRVVVGTHAVLSGSVDFQNLGLAIVDEEQRFGVKEKERLKHLRETVHVLTLTATPIPRTLQLSLAGVRELSVLATPPADRLSVRTAVSPWDPVIVREALTRERDRGGRSYVICPRVEDIAEMQAKLVQLVPDLRIGVAHGRMAPERMEAVMADFVDGRVDVLLATSIVESGIDVTTANTMIIHRADLFGLAQLHQLRGRVGRSRLRGYCYLTYRNSPPISPAAERRLKLLSTLESLGAGFTLASHDMDMRGVGDLLGEEQSGHMREVGAELFQRMLKEALERVEGGAIEDEEWTPTINLGMPILIPESYVADLQTRMDLYRRIARLGDDRSIEAMAAELIDRFGPLPQEVENLLSLTRIRRLCKVARIERFDAGPKGAMLAFRGNSFPYPERLIAFITQKEAAARLRPDQRLVLGRAWDEPHRRLRGVERVATEMARLAA